MLGALLRERRRDTRLRNLALAALVLVVALSFRDLGREEIVHRSEVALQRQTLALQRGDAPLVGDTASVSPAAPPRALVHRALYLGRVAESFGSGLVRRRLVAEAEAAIDRAIAARPHWGEAWTVRAYLGSICGCQSDATIATALARSYGDAPFLRGAAPWRVKTGLRLWPLLSAATRGDVVEEGVWSARSDQGSREELLAAFRDSPAYASFFLLWRELRRGDADIEGTVAPAP